MMGRLDVIPWNIQPLSCILIGCIFYGVVWSTIWCICTILYTVQETERRFVEKQVRTMFISLLQDKVTVLASSTTFWQWRIWSIIQSLKVVTDFYHNYIWIFIVQCSSFCKSLTELISTYIKVVAGCWNGYFHFWNEQTRSLVVFLSFLQIKQCSVSLQKQKGPWCVPWLW